VILKNLNHLKTNSLPNWLSQVREIPKSPATVQAFEALKHAATPNELAIAEHELTAAVLADIATEMAPRKCDRSKRQGR
jgi:ferric-dicitrate binding protein FerR (iron transport regulator)